MTQNLFIIDRLKAIVPENRLLTDDGNLKHYGTDWSRLADPAPLAVVLPTEVEQVQAIVKLANELNFSLVPSGGRTGLSGGAVAAQGEVVVALDGMNKILDFNAADSTVTCQAGVVTQQLQIFAEQNHLFYPVDFASSGSSQIGGNIATNAGGIKVIRYGLTRDWVRGLKVVTGAGEILELNHGLIKNATGYDFRHLFIGSEGTLGFIVEATMELCPPPKNLSVLVLGVTELTALMSILQHFQSVIPLTAFEFFSHQAMQQVLQHSDVAAPFTDASPFYALLEFELTSEVLAQAVIEAFEYCMEQGWAIDGVQSQSVAQLKSLWRLREGISESIAVRTPYKNDISVLVSQVPDFLNQVQALVTQHYPDFELIWFGHIGDGNLHLNILKPAHLEKAEFFAQCKKVSAWVFDIVQQFHGSISAEHGVGLLKKHALHYSRSAAEIELMRQVKKVFDPKGVMNPGKVFDL